MKVKEFSLKDCILLPPTKGTCPTCATVHDEDQPHNWQSFYYQMKFQQEHDRVPTWVDAMAHCSAEVQEAWKNELRKRGISVD